MTSTLLGTNVARRLLDEDCDRGSATGRWTPTDELAAAAAAQARTEARLLGLDEAPAARSAERTVYAA